VLPDWCCAGIAAEGETLGAAVTASLVQQWCFRYVMGRWSAQIGYVALHFGELLHSGCRLQQHLGGYCVLRTLLACSSQQPDVQLQPPAAAVISC
jgi:hypothetical protein